MKKILKTFIVFMTIISLFALIGGCEKEGTAEKAGKKVDQTIQSMKKKIHDATE